MLYLSSVLCTHYIVHVDQPGVAGIGHPVVAYEYDIYNVRQVPVP